MLQALSHLRETNGNVTRTPTPGAWAPAVGD